MTPIQMHIGMQIMQMHQVHNDSLVLMLSVAAISAVLDVVGNDVLEIALPVVASGLYQVAQCLFAVGGVEAMPHGCISISERDAAEGDSPGFINERPCVAAADVLCKFSLCHNSCYLRL